MVANYPWDNLKDPNDTYSASPDDATFRHLARIYADAHADMHNSNEFPEGITNGAQWYPISGGLQVRLGVMFSSCFSHGNCRARACCYVMASVLLSPSFTCHQGQCQSGVLLCDPCLSISPISYCNFSHQPVPFSHGSLPCTGLYGH